MIGRKCLDPLSRKDSWRWKALLASWRPWRGVVSSVTWTGLAVRMRRVRGRRCRSVGTDASVYQDGVVKAGIEGWSALETGVGIRFQANIFLKALVGI